MEAKFLKELNVGDFFVLRKSDNDSVSSRSVWIKGNYERSCKRYSCCKFDDANHENFFSPSKVVYVDFDF